MATARIQVHRCIVDDHTLPTADSRMASRVIFDVIVEGDVYKDCWVELSQPYGTDYEKEPVEVGRVRGFPVLARWGHIPFSDAIEAYYRTIIGRIARSNRTEGATNPWMRDNTVESPHTFEITLPE